MPLGLTGAVDKDHESILEPHPSAAAHLKPLIRPRIIVVFGIIGVFLVVAQLMMGNAKFQHNGDPVPHWKVFTVMNTCILMVIVMVLNPPSLPCEVVLILGSALFAFLGIIRPETLLAGLSDTTVTSVALLFPMAKAVSDTGALESFAARVLGTPQTVRGAVVRLWLLVGLLSAVVNNTPMIAMMIPVLELWTQRLGLDISQLAMPMAFASQMGGSLTLMGSPTNFAAQATFAKWHKFGFFELTIHASILFVFGLVYSACLVPLLLGNQGRSEELAHSLEQSSANVSGFEIVFRIQPHSIFINMKAEDAGFQRLPGVLRVQNVVRNGVVMGAEDPAETLGTDSSNGWRDVQLQADDLIVLGATAEGVAALRSTRGLQMPIEGEVLKLGAHRRQRSLFEVEVSPTSSLIGQCVGVHNFRFEHKCAILAVRHRAMRDIGSPVCVGTSGGLHRRGARNSVPNLPMPFVAGTHVPVCTFDGYKICDADVLLVETNVAEVHGFAWRRDFGLIRQVPNSSPPRLGRIQDTLRSMFAVAGAACAIGAYVAVGVLDQKDASLTINLVVLVGLFLLTKTLTIEQVYESMDVSVLLTIVGAFPFGAAFEQVGLDTWIANGLVKFLTPYGKIGCYFAIYAVSAGLSNLISNIAVIVMLGPICSKIAIHGNYPMRAVVVLVTISASAVYTCPIGHQTNLMVRPVGKYAWGDFFRFGFLLQLLHAIVCVLLCALL